MYATDHEGTIPYGPTAPPFLNPAELYPSTGSPTSLLSLRSGASVGLGLLLHRYLADTPKVFFCPGSDQPVDTDAELAKIGTTQAQGSYYYRHAGVTQLFYTPPELPNNLKLDHLGTNREGLPIRVLAMDTQFLPPPGLEAFNVRARTHHARRWANAMFADGSVRTLSNPDGRYTVDLSDYPQLRDAFDKILAVFERADGAP
jgi:prepilin-type processing-associated H-X9-DG protein